MSPKVVVLFFWEKSLLVLPIIFFLQLETDLLHFVDHQLIIWKSKREYGINEACTYCVIGVKEEDIGINININYKMSNLSF